MDTLIRDELTGESEITADESKMISSTNTEEKKTEPTGTYKLKFSQKVYRFMKAWMDFFIALIALILLSPVFIIVAIAIKIDSKGPVFFVQKRVGKNGKLFNCIKFRSMSTEARPDVAGYEYAGVEAYVTKVGAFIRKFSIDELPQFFNMLTFKMSLIGYRPSQTNETELNTARESYDMYQIRPGISGWAQVNGRDVLASNPKKKAEFDAYYLEHFSIWLDIKIFFMTIVKVFKRDGVVEGVVDEEKSEKESDEINSNIGNEPDFGLVSITKPNYNSEEYVEETPKEIGEVVFTQPCEEAEELAASDSDIMDILDGAKDARQEEVV